MTKHIEPSPSVYGLNGLVKAAPLPVVANRNPTANDTAYVLGQTWINQVAGSAYIFTQIAGGAAVWALASPGASEVDTINGLSPVAGNIVVAGGTNITDVNGGNTVTLNLDPAITLATSVTSPLYTSAAADVLIVPGGANDIVLRLGDAAGATFLRVQSSTPADVFTIDSTGALGVLAGLTVTGAFAQTGGAFNVGQDNAANAINIGGGNVARAIGIGNSAAAHVLTLGSVTAAAQTIIQSGTVGLSLNAAGAASPLTLDSVGVLELNSSAGVIGIGNDAVAQNINIGTGAAARTITVGNITGATAVNVNSGTGACAWTTTNGTFGLVTGTGAINLGTDAAAKTITVGNITGATAVNVNSGTGACAWTTTNGTFGLVTGTGAINIGADAAAKTITLGNSTGATSLVLDCGTGALNIGTNAIAHTVTIGNITGATAVNVNSGTGACAWTTTNGSFGIVTGTGAINIGTDAVAKTLTIGNITGATAVNVNSGTGACAWTTTNGAYSLVTGTGAINLGADAAAKTVTIGNVTGASSVIVDVGTGAASFGASATVHTTTIGSVTGASATVIQSGTGDITVTGTVKEIDAEFLYASGDDIIFQSNPLCQRANGTFGVPAGTTGEVDYLMFQEGVEMEQFILGAGQTILAPSMDANGLLASLDLTLAEGVEYNFGAARLNSRHAFTIGTSPAFFFELRYRIADMDGAAPYIFGFRKVEANNATFANYTDYVGIGMNAVTSATEIVLFDELNSGGQTITNTTDLWGGDGNTNTLRVLVSAAGVVTYTINGLAPTATHAFTFDAADVVAPYIRIEHSATPSAVQLISMKIGFQP